MSLVAIDEVAAFAGGLTHFGALGAVAVAAAAEDGDDAATGVRGELAGERDEIAKRVVGVGVVDDDGEGLACIHELEAAGDGLQIWNGFDEVVEWDATGVGRGESGEEIEDIDLAGKMGDNACGACGGFEIKCCTAGCEPMADGLPFALADAVSADFSTGATGGSGELLGVLIVGIDYGNAWSRIHGAVEHEAFGGEVFFHGAVIVEMVASEVGEDGHIELDACGAALVECVTGDFSD